MKNENFIIIQGWMVNELNLSGHELLTYALIYGFSQDGESEYRGSISYLCKFLNCTRKTAIKVLSNLTESNLITKREIYDNNQKFCRYKAIKVPSVFSKPPIVEKLHYPSVETTPPPSGIITPHNTISLDNIEDDDEEENPTPPPINFPNTIEVSKNTIRAHYESFMLTESTQKNNLCMTKRKTKKDMEILCIGYVISLLESGETMDSYKPDFQKHFSNWLNAYGLDNLMKIDKDQVNAQFKKLNLYQDADQAVN